METLTKTQYSLTLIYNTGHDCEYWLDVHIGFFNSKEEAEDFANSVDDSFYYSENKLWFFHKGKFYKHFDDNEIVVYRAKLGEEQLSGEWRDEDYDILKISIEDFKSYPFNGFESMAYKIEEI